jgi:hypothetical protein
MNSGKHITYEAQLGSEDMGTIELKELKKLGNKIRSLRKGRGFTLQDIGNDAGCTKAYNLTNREGRSQPFDLYAEEDRNGPLRQGDSFYFISCRPHGFINNLEKSAEIVWVIGPPTY